MDGPLLACSYVREKETRRDTNETNEKRLSRGGDGNKTQIVMRRRAQDQNIHT